MPAPGDGLIDPQELNTVLKANMVESQLSLTDDSIEQLTLAIFEVADVDKDGGITFDELSAVLEQYPDVMNNLSIR